MSDVATSGLPAYTWCIHVGIQALRTGKIDETESANVVFIGRFMGRDGHASSRAGSQNDFSIHRWQPMELPRFQWPAV